MKQIWNATIPVDDAIHEFNFGEPFRIVKVGFKEGGDSVTIWFEVDPEHPLRYRRFRIFGTGQVIPDGYEYIGTAQLPGFPLVWHLYEVS